MFFRYIIRRTKVFDSYNFTLRLHWQAHTRALLDGDPKPPRAPYIVPHTLEQITAKQVDPKPKRRVSARNWSGAPESGRAIAPANSDPFAVEVPVLIPTARNPLFKCLFGLLVPPTPFPLSTPPTLLNRRLNLTCKDIRHQWVERLESLLRSQDTRR